MQKIFFKRFALAFMILAGAVFTVSAQTRQGNRWLIVTDTSLSMKSRTAATQDAVERMFLSGMSGQLRPGDTIGMWTFNEALHSGEFPLQVWVPESRQSIAALTGQFIKNQGYEKAARFDPVMSAINNIVTNSDVITVILITDGSEKIGGTPYDDTINKALKQDYSYQKKMDQPFVITLRGVRGKFSGYTVNPAPWPVGFVRLPPEPEPVVVVKPVTEPKPDTKPQPIVEPAQVVPSLILKGVKPEPAPPVQPAKAPDETPTVSATPEPVQKPVVVTSVETAKPVTVPENPPATIKPTPAPAVVEVKSSPTPQTEAKPQIEVAVTAMPAKDNATIPAALKEPVNPPTAPTPTVSVEPARDKASSTEIAVVTPIGADSGSRTTLIVGVGLLVVALGLGIFWLLRPRHAGQASLITRSLDKDKK